MKTSNDIADGMWMLSECGEVVSRATSVEEWVASRKADPVIAKTGMGEAIIQTVFLGLNYGTNDIPMFFETLVIGGNMSGRVVRYMTKVGALRGHKDMVERVRYAA